MSKYVYPESRLPSPATSKLLSLVGENRLVLEIGCALGFQTRSMRQIQNCRIVGIEIDADAARQAAPDCEKLIIGDVETVDLDAEIGDDKFDVITFADVLEHLKAPAAALQKVRPFLRPGGCVVASIPNITHCAVIYEMAHGNFEYRSLGLLDNTHIRFFTRQTVYDIFESSGFQIVSLDRIKSRAEETEFLTTPQTEQDIRFLEYIKKHNPEAETYQFIIKAIAFDDAAARQSELIATKEENAQLRLKMENQVQQIAELQSKLQWLTSQPGYRLLSKIKRLVKLS